MPYIIAAIFAVFCIIVIIISLKVYRENRKMASGHKKLMDEDDEMRFRR